jgi:hypothetical protein
MGNGIWAAPGPTSARARSTACRRFFDGDVVASEETRERTTACLGKIAILIGKSRVRKDAYSNL